MTRWLLALALVAFYVLHQDAWFWDSARPLVFGFLPVGLFYHAAYSVGVAALMVLIVRYAWPAEIEHEAERHSKTPKDRPSGGAR